MADFTPFHGQSFGARLGTNVGRAIGQGAGNAFQSGIDRLAEQQLYQISQHRAQQAQETLQNRYLSQGFSPQESGFLSLLGDKAPDILKSAVEKGFWPGAGQETAANIPSQPQQGNAPQNMQVQPSRPQMMAEKQPAVQVGSPAQYQPPYAEAPKSVQQNGLQIPGVPAGVDIPDYLAKAVAPQPRTGSFREAASRGKPLTEAEKARLIGAEVRHQKNLGVQQGRLENEKNRVTEQGRHNKVMEAASKEERGAARTEREQVQIDKNIAKYDQDLDKRYIPADEGITKLGEMKKLLESGDELSGSFVSEGFKGALPYITQNTASKRFNDLGQDVATLMAALQTGAQTISKIKYNEARKPNLKQDRATQKLRVDDALQELGKVTLEHDIRDYLVALNDDKTPKNLKGKISDIYGKVSKLPPVPENAQENDIFDDPKTGIKWIVRGPIMRFHGFINKGAKNA